MRFRVVAPAYPAFNIYSRIARQTTALGPVSVATVASTLQGWDAEVIDENNYRKFGPVDSEGLPDHRTLQVIRRADVVGLYGGLSSTIPRLYRIARFYKENGAITIAGGQHFTGDNIADALKNGIDYVVIGEGVHTTAELLNAIRSGAPTESIAGIAYLKGNSVVMGPPRPPMTDFNSLPIPDFSLVRYARITLFPVGWIRGCGMNCEFCTVKGTPRPAEPERVLEQIASILEKHHCRNIFIVDDLFGWRKDETMRVCRLLADYQKAVNTRLNLTVQIRLDRGRDTELLQAMREAGVNTVCIGFESPIPEELAAMNKKTKPEEMIELTRMYHKNGFFVHGMFIFGYPLPSGASFNMQAQERVRIFRRFIAKARLDTIQVLLPVPLPGTEMTRRLAEQRRIFPLEEIGWEYYDGNFPLFMPDPPMTPAQMQASIRKIMGRFYRFRSMFSVAKNVIMFPALVFTLFDIRAGWRSWYRTWRNDLIRFGGWLILRRWLSEFRKNTFSERLRRAEEIVKRAAPAG